MAPHNTPPDGTEKPRLAGRRSPFLHLSPLLPAALRNADEREQPANFASSDETYLVEDFVARVTGTSVAKSATLRTRCCNREIPRFK
jgi:hypothetical protein